MPTEAFFNLEENKKNSLLESAIDEFAAQPYEKVSVFKIAQKAEVSRSGFYYYFNDKEDIYKYLIDQIKGELIKELDNTGKKYDIFSFVKIVFYQIAKIKDTKREQFVKQVVENIKTGDTKEYFEKFENCTTEEQCRYISGLEHLKASSDQELRGLICLLMGSTMYALQQYFEDKESLEDAAILLDWMFDTVKYGVMK